MKHGHIVTIGLGVVIIVMLAIWLFGVATRECSVDTDCPDNHYCGSDFSCHEFKVVEAIGASYVGPALILGIALVVAAYVFRGGKLRWRKEKVKPVFENYYEAHSPENYSNLADPLKQEWHQSKE